MQYLKFAKLAYKCSLPKEVLQHGKKINENIIEGFFHSTPNDAQYYTFVCNDNSIIFSFRGSSSLNDFMVDANIFKICVPQFGNNVYVHRGFHSQFIEIDEEIKTTIQNYKPTKITCVGHSLGGALATLVSLSIKKKFDVEVTCCTFGSPRVGNYAFSKEFDDNVDISLRYVNENDIVTSMPRLLYYHVRGEIYLGNKNNDSWFHNFFGSVKDHYLDCYEKSILQ